MALVAMVVFVRAEEAGRLPEFAMAILVGAGCGCLLLFVSSYKK